MDSPLKIDIKTALSYTYLQGHNLFIKLPKNKIQRTKLLQVIFNTIPNKFSVNKKVSIILKIITGCSKNTFYTAYYNHFEITQETVGKKLASNKDLISRTLNETFIVSIIERNTGRIRFQFKMTDKFLKEIKVKDEPAIDVEEVLRLRENEIIRPSLLEPKTRHEREQLSLKILKLFATGYMSIMEACERVGIKYIDFGVWVHSDQIIRKHYLEALIVRSFLVTSRNITEAQDYIGMLFKQGFRTIENSEYSKLFTNGHPEGVWIERKRNVQKVQFNFTEISTLIREIKESAIPNLLVKDELEGFSQEELADYADNMQLRLTEAKKRRSENE